MEKIKSVTYLKNKSKWDKQIKEGTDDLVLLDYDKYERLIQMAIIAKSL